MTADRPLSLGWSSRIAASLTIGFAAVVAMWVAWFLLNLPSVSTSVPHAVSGLLILLVAAAVLLVGCCRTPHADRVVVGLIAGFVAGLVNLLALGTQLTSPTADGAAAPGSSGLKPDAWLIVVCFLAVMAAAGLVAGFGARSLGGARERRTPASWLASFALVNAVAILPLLTLGGLVTSAKAGFAVPDWPGTYGANMFLYPIALMSEPRIFLEHSHRLFGTMVGTTTLVGFVFALCCAPKGWMKLAATGLLLLVIAQGVAGGYWTQEKSRLYVIAHAVVGQVYFALSCAYAAGLSERWARWRADTAARATTPTPRTGIIVLLALLFVQLVMGTMVRHPGAKGGNHALFTHIGLSAVIVLLAIIVGTKMMRLKQTPVHGKSLWLAGHAPMVIVGLQFLLGWVAFLVWQANPSVAAPLSHELASAESIKPLDVLVRTAHQANGALLLGASAVMAVWGLAGLASRRGT
ncbi:MAG: COX15/CtaA family protein [Phycisphaerales bacterium]|nr:COX15/CtaA family protein [Phycisphaerales bacterium]